MPRKKQTDTESGAQAEPQVDPGKDLATIRTELATAAGLAAGLVKALRGITLPSLIHPHGNAKKDAVVAHYLAEQQAFDPVTDDVQAIRALLNAASREAQRITQEYQGRQSAAMRRRWRAERGETGETPNSAQ